MSSLPVQCRGSAGEAAAHRSFIRTSLSRVGAAIVLKRICSFISVTSSFWRSKAARDSSVSARRSSSEEEEPDDDDASIFVRLVLAASGAAAPKKMWEGADILINATWHLATNSFK